MFLNSKSIRISFVNIKQINLWCRIVWFITSKKDKFHDLCLFSFFVWKSPRMTFAIELPWRLFPLKLSLCNDIMNAVRKTFDLQSISFCWTPFSSSPKFIFICTDNSKGILKKFKIKLTPTTTNQVILLKISKWILF